MMHGTAQPRFGSVADAFARLLDVPGELGGACAVYVDGSPVVDLWGGLADRATGRPWARDTMVLFFSVTKGVTAIALHHMAERGLVDLDAPVARYWPAFAQSGKAHIPLCWVLSHRAGVPVVDGAFSLADMLAGEPVARLLAAQAPAWEPGTAHAYHARTFGVIMDQVVRGATGRSAGRYVAGEIAAPLGLDLHIGLPAELEPRVATLEAIADAAFPPLPPSEGEPWNSRALHAAELPSSNGIGDARSLARLYAACVDEVDGVRLLGAATVERARQLQAQGMDRVLDMPTAFGLGFALPPFLPAGAGAHAFGHGGAGGSCAFADPDRRLAFAFVVNGFRDGPSADARVQSLVDAVDRSLSRGAPLPR